MFNLNLCVMSGWRPGPQDSSDAGVKGGCECPDAGAENQTQVLCKSRVCSQLLGISPTP